MSPMIRDGVRGLVLAMLAGCAAGQANATAEPNDSLPPLRVSVVRDLTLQQARWVQPVGHLSSPFKERLSLARTIEPSTASSVLVACEEIEWGAANEEGKEEWLSSKGWIRELDLDAGIVLDSIDVSCAMTGYSSRTNMFWDSRVAEKQAVGDDGRWYWVGDSSARGSQGVAALLSTEGANLTMSRIHLGDGPAARLGEVVAVGRAPAIDGGYVLWAAAPGFMGDHTSTPATVQAFSSASSAPLYTLHGTEGFGRQMLAVDDIDGDQHDDLVVSGEWRGRWGMNETTAQSQLTASLRFAAFSGRTGAVLWDQTRTEPYGQSSMVQVMDVDGDGLRDLAVAQQAQAQLRIAGARLLVLSSKDGQPLREFRPMHEERISIGRVVYADAAASRHRGVLAIGYRRDRDGREDQPCSGVALLSAESGEELARIEVDGPVWRLGWTLLVADGGPGDDSGLIVTLEDGRDRPDSTDYVLRYDLRP